MLPIKRAPVRIRRPDFRRRGEVFLGSDTNQVSVRSAAVNRSHIETPAVHSFRIGKDVAQIEDLVADERFPAIFILRQEADEKMIVVAQRLIPGDGLIQTCRLIRLLEVDRVGAGVVAGTGDDPFAVDHIDIPAQFIILGIVAGVAQREAEINRRVFVQFVDGPNCGVENMRRIQHDTGVGRGDPAPVTIENGLRRCFLV